MIGSLTFTRDDGETFTFSSTNPPYQLTPDTLLPAGLALDVSGGEYTGRNGGYTLAGRLQRRTAKIVYNVRETYADSRSMVQLLNDAAEFFRPMTADLRIVSFDMLVQTDDGNKSAYVMRQGHVTTPFMAPLLRGGHGSYAAEFDLIFDDPLLYWADGSGVVSGDILPAALPGSKIGEVWQEGLQVWASGLSRWEYPDQGGGGTPQTVRVVSAYQVPVAFTITGQITNPKIVNSRNGSQWSWEGTIPYGRVVTVDVDGVATDWQGNRLLNTMGGLVAAPGDNTFTLTGSDLELDVQAAWTGTPNASTSTLSHDGQVVATNYVPNPGFETGDLTGWNQYNMQRNPGFETGDLTGWNQSGWSTPVYVNNFSTHTGSYKAIGNPNPSGLSVLYGAQNAVTAGDVLTLGVWVYADASFQGKPFTLGIVDNTGTTTVSNMTFTQTGNWYYYSTTVTVPSGVTTAAFRFAIYNTGVGDYLRFDDASITSNKVSLERQGAYAPALSSGGNWLALLYVGSGVESPVTITSAFHVGFMAYAVSSGRSVSVVANGRVFQTFQLTAGSWVRCDVDTTSLAPSMPLAFVASGSGVVRVDNVIMCTQSDWQAMQSLGIDWFDGDSTFNIVTAKASVEIRGAF